MQERISGVNRLTLDDVSSGRPVATAIRREELPPWCTGKRVMRHRIFQNNYLHSIKQPYVFCKAA